MEGKRGRKGGREEGSEGRREEGREGERERERDGGREEWRDGRKGEREEWREGGRMETHKESEVTANSVNQKRLSVIKTTTTHTTCDYHACDHLIFPHHMTCTVHVHTYVRIVPGFPIYYGRRKKVPI